MFGFGLDRDIADYIIKVVLQDNNVKAELQKQIEAEIDIHNNKYSQYDRSSFNALTSGNVNMQYRMAQAGYQAYGRTILSGQKDTSNVTVYQEMKNKIRYGRRPENGYTNRGSYSRDI